MVMSSQFQVLGVSVALIMIIILCAGCTQSATSTPKGTSIVSPEITTIPGSAIAKPGPAVSEKKVRLETTMGNITIALDPEMPITTGHFESLVARGFYNGVIFHRVMDGFMIQSGDPTGTGSGGSGSPIPDEFTSNNRNDRGTVAMANAGPNTGDSQFFINLVNNNYLDKKHPVFGTVVEGMDVVDLIAKTRTGPDNRPLQNVTILKASLI